MRNVVVSIRYRTCDVALSTDRGTRLCLLAGSAGLQLAVATSAVPATMLVSYAN